MSRKTRIFSALAIPLVSLAILAVPAVASAQESEERIAEPEADDYTSPDRAHCEEELRKDDRWRSDLRNQLRRAIHEEDANAMLTNKKHVVYAYAALWIMAVGFLVFMWIRQQKLKETIAALERDIARASLDDDDGGGYDDIPDTD